MIYCYTGQIHQWFKFEEAKVIPSNPRVKSVIHGDIEGLKRVVKVLNSTYRKNIIKVILVKSKVQPIVFVS